MSERLDGPPIDDLMDEMAEREALRERVLGEALNEGDLQLADPTPDGGWPMDSVESLFSETERVMRNAYVELANRVEQLRDQRREINVEIKAVLAQRDTLARAVKLLDKLVADDDDEGDE